LGEDPVGSLGNGAKYQAALTKLEKLIVCDLFRTETAKLADLVLPASAWAESDGSFVNSEGRRQAFKAGIEPLSGKTTCQLLIELGGEPSAHLPPEKKGQVGFAIPRLKKAPAPAAGYASDILERKAAELKSKHGLSH
jgi:predicted molibdopterin-dependent oxidoreductase YjgC